MRLLAHALLSDSNAVGQPLSYVSPMPFERAWLAADQRPVAPVPNEAERDESLFRSTADKPRSRGESAFCSTALHELDASPNDEPIAELCVG
jgi:hypothetical protein